MTTTYEGQLEIDTERGVIYFHLNDEDIVSKAGSVTLMRICGLPSPIPTDKAFDITCLVCTTTFGDYTNSIFLRGQLEKIKEILDLQTDKRERIQRYSNPQNWNYLE